MIVLVWGTESKLISLLADILPELGLEVHILPQEYKIAQDELARKWSNIDFVVCVAPLPLCVRLISGLPRSKYYDPAVLQIDLTNREILCLCGEHFKGGVRLARLISHYTGLNVKETSRARRLGLTTLDELCFMLRLDPSDLALLTRYIKLQCRGVRVRLRLSNKLLKVFQCLPNIEYSYDLIVDESLSDREIICEVYGESKLTLRARTLALGVGMCSCASVDDLLFTLRHALSLFGMPACRIDIVCVPSLRRDHVIPHVLTQLGLKVVFQDIDLSDKSVSIAEKLACSILARPRLLVRRVKGKHVTVALAEEHEER